MKKILFILALAPFAVNAQDHHDGPHKDMQHPVAHHSHHHHHGGVHHTAPVQHPVPAHHDEHPNDHRNDGRK